MANLYNALSGGQGRNDLQMSAPATPGMSPPPSSDVPGPSLFESLAGNFPALINQKTKGQTQQDTIQGMKRPASNV